MLHLLMSPDTVSGPSPPTGSSTPAPPAARIAIDRWLSTHPAPDPAAPQAPPTPPAPGLPRSAPRAATRATQGPVRVVEGTGPTAAGIRLAGCCTPVPPDEVTGFTVRGGTVTVHRAHCPAVDRMVTAGRHPVEVHWRNQDGACGADYRVTLRAESFSRPHLLADLTEVIAAKGAAVISAAVEPPHEQRVRHTYTLQLPDAAQLPDLMRAMRRVPGVYDVERAGRQVAAVPL
ncbi:hypothetical protein GCM10020000_20950 [Streptomyces olivoverticillatus]